MNQEPIAKENEQEQEIETRKSELRSRALQSKSSDTITRSMQKLRLKKRLAGDGCRRCGLNPIGAKESLCRGSRRLHFGSKEELQYQLL